MSSNSDIEWTDATWNPVVGCTRVGGDDSGCAHCYAEGQAPRIAAKLDRPTTIKLAGKSKRTGLTFTPKDASGRTLGLGARWTGSVWMLPDVLATPLHWRAPRKVFVNSMSDLFHENLVDSEEGRRFIAAVFGVMAATPHTYQVLTKRPEKAREWFARLDERVEGFEDSAAPAKLCVRAAIEMLEMPVTAANMARLEKLLARDEFAWPLSNVWLGVSAEHQRAADERVPVLLELPAAVRFVSYEPALGPVDWTRIRLEAGSPLDREGADFYDALAGRSYWADGDTGANGPSLDWLICGGESGKRARPMHPAWARSARDQCEAAGTAFFFKQWGEWGAEDVVGPNQGPKTLLSSDGSRLDAGKRYQHACVLPPNNFVHNGQPALDGHPDRLTMARVGKAAAGRELDGRTHDGYPASGTTRSP